MAAGGMWQFISPRGQEYGLARNGTLTSAWTPRRPPGPRRATSTICTTSSETGTWQSRLTTADPWWWRMRSSAPGLRISGNFATAACSRRDHQLRPHHPGDDHHREERRRVRSEQHPHGSPLEYDTVDLGAPTNLALVSDLTGTPLPQLTELNPAVLCGVAPKGTPACNPRNRGAALQRSRTGPAERRDACASTASRAGKRWLPSESGLAWRRPLSWPPTI